MNAKEMMNEAVITAAVLTSALQAAVYGVRDKRTIRAAHRKKRDRKNRIASMSRKRNR